MQTLPGTFLRHGYLTASYGKFIHSGFQADDVADYTPGYYKMHGRKGDVTHTETGCCKHIDSRLAPARSPARRAGTGRGASCPTTGTATTRPSFSRTPSRPTARSSSCGEEHDRPFFLACGFWRPHVPWTVPQRYYDRFPLDKIELPAGYQAGDLDDLPKPGRWLATHSGDHAEVVAGDMWKKSLQGYYASMTYIDEQIGRVLDALESGPHKDDTIVVFFSDNGMHLGEKDHWLKYALWEQTCRVFLSISVPGHPAAGSETPVEPDRSVPDADEPLRRAAAVDAHARRHRPDRRARRPKPRARPAGALDLRPRQSRDPRRALPLHPLPQRRRGTLRPRERPARVHEPRRRRSAARREGPPRQIHAGGEVAGHPRSQRRDGRRLAVER